MSKTKPIIVRRRVVDRDGNPTGEVNFWFWCPGCDAAHRYSTGSGDGPRWAFNDDMEKPTFTPSLLNTYGESGKVCHLFMTNGQLSFCSDCTHELAGKTVDVPPVPDWLK